MPAVAFELDISLGELSNVQLSFADVPALDATTWFVRCSADDIVTVHAVRRGRVCEIGRARWSPLGRLVERTNLDAAQWKRVATALGRVKRRAYEGMPAWRRVLGSIDPTARRILVRAVVVGLAAIAVVVAIYVVRTKDPVRASLAPYDDLAWRDVADGGETTVSLIQKDPERERGRKLCVTGTVDEIERTTIDGRAVHAGSLRTSAGDVARFIALGSTRSVVTRSTGRLCGVVHEKASHASSVAIVGFFDLPENRHMER